MSDLQNIIATVDVAIFTIVDNRLCLILTRRLNEPEKGRLSLPGGYIHVDKDRDSLASAKRILKDKAGLTSPYLEQLFTYSGVDRDPRGWSITICYYALVPVARIHGELGENVEVLPVDEVRKLPFDHDRIVQAALGRLRNKSTYSTLPLFLLPKEFTLTEMQKIYEIVLGTALPTQSFRRKIDAQKIIVATGYARSDAANRPAALYRLNERGLREFDRKV